MNIEKVLEIFEKSIESAVLSEHFIVWAGDNLMEVCRFTGLHKKFMDWFPSWLDYVKYVEEHDSIFKVFTDNGHYEVPVGSWLVKAPDGSVHAFGEGVRFVSKEEKELQKKIDEIEIPITLHEEEKPITTFIPEDPYETEVVEEGSSISLRRKLDKDGNPILKKRYSAAVDPAHGKDWSSFHAYESKSNKPNWMKKFVKEADKWKK